MGAQRSGPTAKPTTNRESPSIDSSVDTWNSAMMAESPPENALLTNATASVEKAVRMVIDHFFAVDQSWGL